ncbi:hypothetical protein [Luteibacter sp. UNCMF331Sha3.1]|uniref:hypothetical protein n=1 Tax=Luteibacter sp. UNCMF331Sha3.1 TaxID=1502760 RepID=UPI000B7CB96C|nr:hypothetical protein [Luteibacter sp. UNCMF331Sha3.1]
MFTGDNGNRPNAIDESLASTQLALKAIRAVNVVTGDTEMQNATNRSALIAAFGVDSTHGRRRDAETPAAEDRRAVS